MMTTAIPKRAKLIEAIEERTKSRVGIDCFERDAVGKFNEQESSPLFTMLPRELRDEIWAYATAPFEDPNCRFEATEYYYRPGHTARLKTDTALLLTCRRIWLEANALPMLQAEHCFYYMREAPDKRDPEWMASLTEHNRQDFGHLHMFAQMIYIEDLSVATGSLRDYFLKTPALPGDFQPRILHVTIRHTDWWWWENEAPLRLEDHWVHALLDSPDLRSTETLRLELETLDYKINQLQPILERVKRMESKEIETHVIDGRPVKTRFVLAGEPEVYQWEGPANINKQQFGPYAGKSRLKYHVVTLTWKLKFVDIPNAFVPELRRAPRIGFVDSGRTEAPYPTAEYDHSRAEDLEQSSSSSNANSSRRKRKRKASPREQQHHRGLRTAESNVRLTSRGQAERVGSRRRADHGQSIAETNVKHWQEKWAAERSLLKFVD